MQLLQRKSELSRKLQHSISRIFLLLTIVCVVSGIIFLSVEPSLTLDKLFLSPTFWLILCLISALLIAYLYLKQKITKLYEQEYIEPLAEIQTQLRSFDNDAKVQELITVDNNSPFAGLIADINALLEKTKLQQLNQHESEEKFANLYYALEESDSYFRAIFQQTNEGIILLKDNGNHFYEFNQSALDILGYKRAELATHGLSDIVINCRDANGSLLLTDKNLPERFTATFITYQGHHLECHVSAKEIEI
ncbi:MAG: PAS domain S-box protein, partial [Gammaproteobacteria bacterium]|nr:PAS domain S-box protein [Gammaproteobacteria bacterium]